MREGVEAKLQRWRSLNALQLHYVDFREFLVDVMEDLLGFKCTDMQLDISLFIQQSGQNIMVQAQRGEAKTTVTAAYAVWMLIHNPGARILIVSSREDMANEIAGWVIQIIRGMDQLECMRPDTNEGDRCSIKNFDIHYSLKGAEKSPSIKSLPITGSMSGARADILIADDIETPKNSQTEIQREHLRNLTKEFTSICSNGRIIYLGTPQSIDSIYNSLADRGYEIRIWPGRYPTEAEETNYGGLLAPYITERLRLDPSLRTGGGMTGMRGKPTDPVLLGESALTKKELDQGPAYFQLQHMLDTRLSDADRFPLKPEKLVVQHVNFDRAPIQVVRAPSEDRLIDLPRGYPLRRQTRLYRPGSVSGEHVPWQGTIMFVDPAGGGKNGDETAWAVTSMAAGNIWLRGVGGFSGPIDERMTARLTKVALKYKPQRIFVEKNYGNGALANVWQPELYKVHRCAFEEPWSTGQKELRIIDTLEPIIGSGRFIIDHDVIEQDWASCQQYPPDVRNSYCFMYQFSRISRARGSLLHDDRLEAVSGACVPWIENLRADREKALAADKAKAFNERLKNPLGNGRPAPGWKPGGGCSVMNNLKFLR